MAKVKTRFVCANCGAVEPKWLGRCSQCGEWNTFSEEEVLPKKAGTKAADVTKKHSPVKLADIASDLGSPEPTGIQELNRVLGGGIIPGASILLGGEPGIGKSTLLLHTAASIAKASKKGRVLYIAGEEAPHQILNRAKRIQAVHENIEILAETEIESICRWIQKIKPSALIVDSIQTLYSRELGPVPGTVNQLRLGCHEIIGQCKELHIPVFLVAHVTKGGSIAGPKIIEHMVDTVLYFEHSGSELRFLRAAKNRYGSVDEIGIFTMESEGLIEVADPGAMFLNKREGDIPPGVVAAPIYEGSRILMVEIQALTVQAKGSISRSFSDKIDNQRVQRVAAVLEKHLGISFSDQDIYINVAGGIRINEVAVDLPLAMALYSARTGIPIPQDTCISGEVTLAAEVRSVGHLEKRTQSAADLGFKQLMGPRLSGKSKPAETLVKEYLTAGDIKTAVNLLFR